MIPKTGNVSLLQALADCDILKGEAEYSLNNRVFRDRRGVSGNVNLNSLRGTVTSMHQQIYGSYGDTDPQHMRKFGFKKTYLNPAQKDVRVLGNFTTEISCTGNRNGDVGIELLHHGYCGSGAYNVAGTKLEGVGTSISDPASVNVIVASNGWLDGNVEYLLTEEINDRWEEPVSKDFTVPAGKPYVTLVLRQLVRSTSIQIRSAPFKNVRITQK